MTTNNPIVSIHGPHADDTLNALQRSSFDTRKLSILAGDDCTDERAAGFHDAVDRMKFGRMDAVSGCRSVSCENVTA